MKIQTIMKSLWIGSLVLASVACGTRVETGRNAKNFGKKNDATTGEQHQKTENTTSRVTKVPLQSGTCGGIMLESSSLFPLLNEICAGIHQEDKLNFQKIYKTLCEEKIAANLLDPQCSWQGDEHELPKHLHVLEHTKLTDPNKEFYLVNFYSMQLPQNSKYNFKELTILAYSKPQVFAAQNFKLPKSTEIIPNKNRGIWQQGEADFLEYGMKVKSQYGDAYVDSQLKVYAINDEIDVFFDRAIGGYKKISIHNNLTISRRLQNGDYLIVVIDEKQINDSGLHAIAKKVLLSTEVERMKLYYENSQVQ